MIKVLRMFVGSGIMEGFKLVIKVSWEKMLGVCLESEMVIGLLLLLFNAN